VIVAKDREWDMKSVLAAVESRNNPSKYAVDALQNAVDKVKAKDN